MNNDIDNDNDDRKSEKGLKPIFAEDGELLAKELATGLGDMANLKYYQSVARKHPEWLLRNIFNRVRDIPESKIRKSKGALFNYLLQKHGKDDHCD